VSIREETCDMMVDGTREWIEVGVRTRMEERGNVEDIVPVVAARRRPWW